MTTVELPLIDDGQIFGLAATGDTVLELPLIDTRDVVYGPHFYTSDQPDVRLDVYRASTSVTSITDYVDCSFTDTLNEEGAGSIVVDRASAEFALMQHLDRVRFTVEGDVAFTMIVESSRDMAIAPGEEGDELVELSGPGMLGVLKRAVVYPDVALDSQPFSDTRLFNFASPSYDDSKWTTAKQFATQATATGFDGLWTDLPEEWPTPSAWWIWDKRGSQQNAPTGTCYFRKSFTVTSAGRHAVIFGTDNWGTIYLDGIELADSRGWTNYTSAEVTLTAGTHLIAAEVYNGPDDGDPGGNPGGLVCTVVPINDGGTFGTAVVTSNNTWKILGYPPQVPGFTVGEVINLLIEEAQDRGAIPGVTTTFGDKVDSGGDPWPVTADIAIEVGTDLMTVVKALAETSCDIRMGPATPTLSAYQTFGRNTSATFTRGENITDLEHETVA